jgi:Tfp pilus assembly protein PilW
MRTHSRKRLFRRGLGMVEAMISLSITAALLTAVSAAFKASAQAIQANDEFFRSTQAARVSLNRILGQIRNGAVDDASTANSLHLITNDLKDSAGNVIKAGKDVTYRLVTEPDAAKGPMRLVMLDNATGQTYELARNVTTTITTTTPFTVELGKDYNNADCVTRVSVAISVKVGNNEVRLSGAAAPRRNLTY